MRRSYLYMGILLVSAMLLAGCAENVTEPGDQKKPGTVEITPGIEIPLPSDTADRQELRPTQSPPGGLEPAEITLPAPATNEVPPEILDAIQADLVEHSGTKLSDINVIRAEAVVWNDGSLGCPRPGEFYIQMLISGYWVVLEGEGIEYDYRVSDKGSFKLCEGGSVVPPDVENDNPLVRQAKEDLAGRLGIPIGEIELLSYEEVVWPDASRGCPQPGMAYIQVPEDGALIRLIVLDQIYDYHSGGNGEVFLCEKLTKGTKSPPKIDINPPPSNTDR